MFVGKVNCNYVVLLTIPDELGLEWYDLVEELPDDLLLFLDIPETYELASTEKVTLSENFSVAFSLIRMILKEKAKQQKPAKAPTLVEGTPREKELLTADNLDRQVSVDEGKLSINMLRQLEKSAAEKFEHYDKLVTILGEQLDNTIANKEQWETTLKPLEELGKFYEKQRQRFHKTD